MRSYMTKSFARELRGNKNNPFLLILWIIVLLLAPGFFTAAAEAAATEMKHSPPDYFINDQRIQLEAQVEDPAGVKLIRCYFKAAGEANLVFVPMNSMGENKYSGILPAPSATTTQVEYLFLSVNDMNEVVRSQIFFIPQNATKETPDWQKIPKEGKIRVSMELDTSSKKLPGFSDSITIDVVESTARFGVVALLYHTATDASSKGVAAAQASTNASSSGVITAGSTGYSTATIAGIGLGAAVLVGGTAAAVGGGGGGGNDGDDAEALTATSILGDWNNVTGDQNGYSVQGSFTFINDTSFTYSLMSSEAPNPSSGVGKWTLNGARMWITYYAGGGLAYAGNADGDSSAFVFKSDKGDCTLNFRR